MSGSAHLRKNFNSMGGGASMGMLGTGSGERRTDNMYSPQTANMMARAVGLHSTAAASAPQSGGSGGSATGTGSTGRRADLLSMVGRPRTTGGPPLSTPRSSLLERNVVATIAAAPTGLAARLAQAGLAPARQRPEPTGRGATALPAAPPLRAARDTLEDAAHTAAAPAAPPADTELTALRDTVAALRATVAGMQAPAPAPAPVALPVPALAPAPAPAPVALPAAPPANELAELRAAIATLQRQTSEAAQQAVIAAHQAARAEAQQVATQVAQQLFAQQAAQPTAPAGDISADQLAEMRTAIATLQRHSAEGVIAAHQAARAEAQQVAQQVASQVATQVAQQFTQQAAQQSREAARAETLDAIQASCAETKEATERATQAARAAHEAADAAHQAPLDVLERLSCEVSNACCACRAVVVANTLEYPESESDERPGAAGSPEDDAALCRALEGRASRALERGTALMLAYPMYRRDLGDTQEVYMRRRTVDASTAAVEYTLVKVMASYGAETIQYVGEFAL